MRCLLILLMPAVAACSLQSFPGTHDPRSRVVRGANFLHVVIERSRSETEPGVRVGADADADAVSVAEEELVHLYIDGDGRPFINRTSVAADPTPRRSQVLRWMLKDPGPSYYLGRPCYLGMAKGDQCDARWWTTKRYAEPVVESMVVAARQLLHGRPVILIGHSGGGTIAMHMASRLENVRGLLTVGANLDTDAWTRHHGYTPVDRAADPVAVLRELRQLPQLHLLGGKDENVPAGLASGLSSAAKGRFCIVQRFTHDCCWERQWPQLLTAMQSWNCVAVGGELLSLP